MATGPIQLTEIIEALRLLGGQAQAKDIKDKVTELRGGMPAHYGRSHSYRETIQKKIEDHCPQSENWNPSNEPYFKRVSRGIYRLLAKPGGGESASAVIDATLATQVEADLEALIDEEGGTEGGRKDRLIAFFERNPKLRAAAIAYHGTTCKACGFSFEAAYGEHGRNFIEVHHLVPVSTLIEASTIDPRTDLTVLCSNCHRMIHRKRDALLSVEQLSNLLRNRADREQEA